MKLTESLTKIIYSETRINAMKANSSTIKYGEDIRRKEMENDCKLCRAGFELWVSTLNFTYEREEEMRKKLLEYCPVCKLAKK